MTPTPDATDTTNLIPITEVASAAGILPDELEAFGHSRGKVKLSILRRLAGKPDGKLVIVTAITPTKAGEGKTTTSVALTQGLGVIGRKVMLCLREPSMGPVFGVKGGGTGGGRSQLVPMEEINLHFNGDFHAVSEAHNLLAAALDASLYHGNPLRIDPATIIWPRTVDMNDRQLRYSVTGLGGKAHGVPRESEFVITAASEVMASLALATDLQDLRRRLGRIVIGSTYEGEPVTADTLQAAGAMTVILKEAVKPNIVQTMEGQPALVHAGPFGNIAHAANSIVADRIALKLADYVITEAGFASERPSNRKFVTFAAHVLHQDRQMQFAAAGDDLPFRVACLFDSQCDVVDQFPLEPFGQLATRDKLAVAANQRRVGYFKRHADRRFIHHECGQCLNVRGIAQGIGNPHALNSRNRDDVAGLRFFPRFPQQPVKTEYIKDLRVALRAIAGN
jgi:formyltetrahydrofolate synthetase